MVQSFEDAGKAGKEFVDAGLKNFASLSKNVQALAAEATDYSKKSLEQGAAALEKLFGAKSLDKAIEVQTDYAKQAYEGFVAQATKMGELYTAMAKDAMKPLEGALAKVQAK